MLAGITVVIGVAASWITAALGDVAADVVAIADNTARVLASSPSSVLDQAADWNSSDVASYRNSPSQGETDVDQR